MYNWPMETCVELFAGCGGAALGMEMAGFKHQMLVERDRDAAATLRLNRPNWNVIQADVTKVSYSGVNADVVVGGWPCQTFSHSGNRLGMDDVRGTMFYEFARCVGEIRPKMFFGENVTGFVTHDGGRTMRTCLGVLRGLGYSVEHRILRAEHHGVPQRRSRVIMLGARFDLGYGAAFPKPEDREMTLREALAGVPASQGLKYSDNRRRILEMVPPGGNWRDLPRDVAKKFLGEKVFNGDGGRTTYARRLSWDSPCLTLTCSPSQKQTERCHPDETRPLTVREYARIQTFPDWWQFCGSSASQYRQIGNAVPVELARRIGLSLKASETADRELLFD